MTVRGTGLLAVLNIAVIYFIIILSGFGVLNFVETVPFLSQRPLSTSLAEKRPKSPQPRSPLFSDFTSAPPGNTTQKITTDDPNTEVYATLIEAFEKLGLVIPRQQTCYTVKKIVREVFSQDAVKPQRTLGVYLYIEESVLPADPIYMTGGNGPESDSKAEPTNEESNSTSNSDGDREPGCKSAPLIVITGSKPMKEKNSSSEPIDNRATNTTGAVISAHAVSEDNSGLSRTQMVVICTCSAVIGTFFLVAAIMRIRNYVKRTREGRNNNHRPQARAFIGGMRESNSPLRGQNTRTNSINSIGNSKDSVLYSRRSGDNSCEPLLSVIAHGDDKPVLVITSASTSNSPSSSGRGSEEDVSANGRSKQESGMCMEEGEDGRDTEVRPLLCNINNQSLDSDLQGVAFPYIDSPPIVLEANQKLESTTVDGVAPDVSIPSDLADILMLEPETDGVAEDNGGRGLAGLSQSDTSLSSNNPSYRYGNQLEYVNDYADGYDPCFPPLSDEDFTETTDTDETTSNLAMFSERQAFVPKLDSFDSLSGVSFNPSDFNFDVEERKMTPIEELPAPPPELFGGSSLEDLISPNGNNNTPSYNQAMSDDSADKRLDMGDTQGLPISTLKHTSTDLADIAGLSQPSPFFDSNVGKSFESDDSRQFTDSFTCETQAMPANTVLSTDRTSLL